MLDRVGDEMSSPVRGILSPVYRRRDTGEVMHLGWEDAPEMPHAPPGAMWIAPGVGLMVRTPGGDWRIDQASSGGGKWTRRGEPPRVTASPSILFKWPVLCGDGEYHGPPLGHRPYHGFLVDGWLEEC